MQILETQRFRNPWLFGILLLTNVLFLAFGLRQIIGGIPFGNNPAPEGVLIFIMAVPLAILVLFAFSYLRVAYNKEFIHIRYFPFTNKRLRFTENEEMELITYSPFFDYGGWGVRWNLDGWAYIVSGKKGIRIQMKDGKKYLIGIKNPDNYHVLLKPYTNN